MNDSGRCLNMDNLFGGNVRQKCLWAFKWVTVIYNGYPKINFMCFLSCFRQVLLYINKGV